MKEKYSILISSEQPVIAGGASIPAQEPLDLFVKGFVDIAETFTHTLKSKITSVPVEDGFSISDNIVDEPVTLKMVLLTGDLQRSRVSSDFNFQESDSYSDYSHSHDTGANDDVTEDEFRKSLLSQLKENTTKLKSPSEGFAQLTKLKRDRTLLTVTGVFGHYENMLIEKIVIDENVDTGLSLRASVTMKQIRYAGKAIFTSGGVRVVDPLKTWELLKKKVKTKHDEYLEMLEAQKKAAELKKEKPKQKPTVTEIYSAHPWGA